MSEPLPIVAFLNRCGRFAARCGSEFATDAGLDVHGSLTPEAARAIGILDTDTQAAFLIGTIRDTGIPEDATAAEVVALLRGCCLAEASLLKVECQAVRVWGSLAHAAPRAYDMDSQAQRCEEAQVLIDVCGWSTKRAAEAAIGANLFIEAGQVAHVATGILQQGLIDRAVRELRESGMVPDDHPLDALLLDAFKDAIAEILGWDVQRVRIVAKEAFRVGLMPRPGRGAAPGRTAAPRPAQRTFVRPRSKKHRK